MPRNKVQFQKGLSEREFNNAYGSEATMPHGARQMALAEGF